MANTVFVDEQMYHDKKKEKKENGKSLLNI